MEIQSENNELVIRKSNQLISSKMHNNLFTNKLYAIAMTRIEQDGCKENEKLVARLYPGEIQALLGDNGNIYRELKVAAKLMTGQSMVIESEDGNFKAFTIVNEAEYRDGIFKIEFNENIKPHILELTRNYTTLNLSVMTIFDKDMSFRLYEILQKEMYKSRLDVNDGKVEVEYNLNELRFMTGNANINEEKVQRYLARNKIVDWDYLYESVVIEKKYSNWTDFKRYVLKPAQEEIKRTSDIAFDFEGIRVGGNKIRRIRFIIYQNEQLDASLVKKHKSKEKLIKKMNKQVEMTDILYSAIIADFEGHNYLTREDIVLLMNKAGNDEKLVRNAIREADKQGALTNYMGWLIRYIENGGYKSVSTLNGDANKAVVVEEVMKEYKDKKSDIAESTWSKIKQKEEFSDFEEYLTSNGISLIDIEVVYDAAEKVSMYTEWKIGVMKNL